MELHFVTENKLGSCTNNFENYLPIINDNDSVLNCVCVIFLQLKQECEAELVLMVIIDSERLEGYIESVGVTVLARRIKIEVCNIYLILYTKTRRKTTFVVYRFHIGFHSVAISEFPGSIPGRVNVEN